MDKTKIHTASGDEKVSVKKKLKNVVEKERRSALEDHGGCFGLLDKKGLVTQYLS